MSYAPFSFVFPTRIIFGPGESGRCAQYVAERKPQKVNHPDPLDAQV